MRSSTFLALAIFLSFLFYFVFGSGWYLPAQLVIDGITPEKDGRLHVLWDSGEGLNHYERNKFELNTVLADEQKKNVIKIQYTGKKNSGSLSATVVCSELTIDGKKVPLARFASGSVSFRPKVGVLLRKKGDSLKIKTRARHHIQISLLTNNHSGSVDICVSGKSKRLDLYTVNTEIRKVTLDYWIVASDGSFSVSMDLPRYAIKKLVVRNAEKRMPIFIHNISLQSSSGITVLPVNRERPLTEIGFDNVNRGLIRHFNRTHFTLQVLFAALSTWILMALYRAAHRCGSFKGIFLKEQRYVFWSFLFGAMVTYSLWLVAFWPGLMSVDSLKIWRAAGLPDAFVDNHPVVNELYYMYLMQFWNNVAVVAISQIFLTSLLGAWIFFSLYRNGMPMALVAPFYLLFVFSIPIGLYTIALWKDIPFALLVVFWAYKLCDMYQKKRQGILEFSAEKLLALGLLFMALAFTRFNGIVYLGAMPLLLAFMKIISFKRFAAGLFICIFAAGTLYFFMRGNSAFENINYVSQQSSRLFNELKDQPLKNQLKRFTRNYFGIFDINQKISRWDIWHYFLMDRYAYTFLRQSGWGDVYPYVDPEKHLSRTLYDLGMKIYRWSYGKPQVYFAWNPFYMLVFFPLGLILFRHLPQSALYSSVIIIQIVTLLFLLKILNWRYYYFAYLACFFLVPAGVVEFTQKMRTVAKKPVAV